MHARLAEQLDSQVNTPTLSHSQITVPSATVTISQTHREPTMAPSFEAFLSNFPRQFHTPPDSSSEMASLT
jgi:hypothetical protein